MNWNGKELLKEFLPSVVRYSTGARIYVIDNASTDDSLNYLKTDFSSVNCIVISQNKGYAGGYNEGLNHLNEDIFILLNNDVEVTENWLDPIKAKFESDRNIGVIQPKILDYKHPQYFEYAGAAGGFIDKYAYPYCKGRLFSDIEKDEGQYDKDSEIFWASGACFAVKKSVFEDLGGFDESYFAHQEEIDFCWRAFNYAYKIWYCHDSKVYHLGGGTLNTSDPNKTYLNFRNSLYNIIKNVPKPHWFKVLFIRLLLDGLACLRFMIKGQFLHIFAVIKAHWIMFSRFFVYYNKRDKKHLKSDYFDKPSIVYHYFILNQNKYRDFE